MWQKVFQLTLNNPFWSNGGENVKHVVFYQLYVCALHDFGFPTKCSLLPLSSPMVSYQLDEFIDKNEVTKFRIMYYLTSPAVYPALINS